MANCMLVLGCAWGLSSEGGIYSNITVLEKQNIQNSKYIKRAEMSQNDQGPSMDKELTLLQYREIPTHQR
jgi:hypothetical protein